MRVKSCCVVSVFSSLTFGLLVLLACLAAKGLCSDPPQPIPSVDELLAQYNQTREKCLHSFAVKSRSTMETNWERSPVPQMRLGRHVLYRESDFRYDGQRVRSRTNGWGDRPTGPSIPKDDPIRNSDIVDLEWRASYSGQRGKPGSIKYYREPLDPEVAKRRAGWGWTGAAGFGYFPSNEPINAYIRRSDKAVVRPNTETVNGSACYVIEAQSQEGQLTVWIDPTHGYHVAKATIVREEGHKVNGDTFPRGHKEESTLTNLSFKQVNGVWVPVEFVYETDIRRPPVFIMNGKTHVEITEFLIDPDHEALKSFEVNDFPEGTRTSYTDNGRLLPTWYIWKNGGPVPDTEKTRGHLP